MKELVRRFVNNENSRCHLSYVVQNNLIQKSSEEDTRSTVREVREIKQFSVMLDCTPDISRLDLMSVTVRISNIRIRRSKLVSGMDICLQV
jgi:hypothetical protein